MIIILCHSHCHSPLSFGGQRFRLRFYFSPFKIHLDPRSRPIHLAALSERLLCGAGAPVGMEGASLEWEKRAAVSSRSRAARKETIRHGQSDLSGAAADSCELVIKSRSDMMNHHYLSCSSARRLNWLRFDWIRRIPTGARLFNCLYLFAAHLIYQGQLEAAARLEFAGAAGAGRRRSRSVAALATRLQSQFSESLKLKAIKIEMALFARLFARLRHRAALLFSIIRRAARIQGERALECALARPPRLFALPARLFIWREIATLDRRAQIWIATRLIVSTRALQRIIQIASRLATNSSGENLDENKQAAALN